MNLPRLACASIGKPPLFRPDWSFELPFDRQNGACYGDFVKMCTFYAVDIDLDVVASTRSVC